jgi:acetyl-CoA carboxylase carboxyl transferase subunit alpha
MRLMRHADRFSMPIITFIDTPGAYPGYEAEEMGQGEAIAYNLREMFGLKVPIVCTIIGEGGSGGALGIGVGDRLLMFEHSVYTVASPEACAAILWKDAGRSGEAAEALKITSWDLKQLGILDELLPEPVGGAHANPIEAADSLKQALVRQLAELAQLSPAARQQQRYQKYRQIGVFAEAA